MDKKDYQILNLLSENCRYSLKKIGATVKLSKDAVKYRITGLVKKKSIYKFLTLINFSTLGYDQYYLFVQLQNVTAEREKQIIQAIKKHPFSFLDLKVSGSYDLVIGLACSGVQHFEKEFRKLQEKLGENLKESEVVIWIRDYKYTHTIKHLDTGAKILSTRKDSSFAKELCEKEKEFARTQKKFVDDKDVKILALLDDDPRIVLTKIGKKINMSGEGVRKRISNLIKKNIIKGFSVVPNFFSLQLQNSLLMLTFKNFTEQEEKRFHAFLKEKDFVAFAFKSTGKWEGVISISAKDVREFNEILTNIKHEFSNIIRTYETVTVLDWYKYDLFPKGIGKIILQE